MADPISVTTSIITAVSAATAGLSKISEVISNFKNAPKNLRELRERADTLASQLQGITEKVESGIRLDAQSEMLFVKCFRKCAESCDDVSGKLGELQQSSKAKLEVWSRVKLSFYRINALKNEIKLCRKAAEGVMIIFTAHMQIQNGIDNKDILQTTRLGVEKMQEMREQVQNMDENYEVRMRELMIEVNKPQNQQDESYAVYSLDERQEDAKLAMDQLDRQQEQTDIVKRLIQHQLKDVMPKIMKDIPGFTNPSPMGVTMIVGSNREGIVSNKNTGTMNYYGNPTKRYHDNSSD